MLGELKRCATVGDGEIGTAECGGAFVVIEDGRTSFARWLRKHGLGHRHHRRGYSISAEQVGQCAESAKAYADAFARVLRRNGIESRSEIYFT